MRLNDEDWAKVAYAQVHRDPSGPLFEKFWCNLCGRPIIDRKTLLRVPSVGSSGYLYPSY